MAPLRRNPRNPFRKSNPVRDLVTEKQRALELAKSRQRVRQLNDTLPSLITNQVDEQMGKLENKLLSDFKQMGQRALEESTAVISEQLHERIETLEKASAIQSKTLTNLRDTTRVAEQKVSSAVDSIEKSLAGAVPGFKLDPQAAPADQTGAGYAHPQFQLEARTDVMKADPREVAEASGWNGFCPNCTSTNVRRANRSGLFEELLRLFFIAPFRCRACRHKFYRF